MNRLSVFLLCLLVVALLAACHLAPASPISAVNAYVSDPQNDFKFEPYYTSDRLPDFLSLTEVAEGNQSASVAFKTSGFSLLGDPYESIVSIAGPMSIRMSSMCFLVELVEGHWQVTNWTAKAPNEVCNLKTNF